MKCIIPGSNLKVLAKAIHALAKIGDEMYVQPQEKFISFRCVNISNSAYADITFNENFFSSYNYGDLEEEDALKCKISMRSAMAVFKTPGALDKQVESCHILLEPGASKLLFIMKHHNSTTKTHLLPIIDCQSLKAVYIKDGSSNHLVCKSRVLLEAIYNFQQNTVEITLEVTPQKVLLRNYVDETSSIANVTRTQLALAIGEFDKYTVQNEALITFCMKEVRAILHLAEAVALPLDIQFESAGKPAVFIMKSPSFESNLLLATLNPDNDDQSENSTIIAPIEKTVKNRSRAKNTTKRAASKNTSRRKPSKKSNQTTVNNDTTNDSFVHPCFLPEEKSKIFNTTASTMQEVDRLAKMSCNDKASEKSIETKSNKKCTDLLSKDTATATTSLFSGVVEKKKESRSIFATHKRKSCNEDNEASKKQEKSDISRRKSLEKFEDLDDFDQNGDVVPNSPPSQPLKKARLIFKKCFECTFDPSVIPGHDLILAGDSDED